MHCQLQKMAAGRQTHNTYAFSCQGVKIITKCAFPIVLFIDGDDQKIETYCALWNKQYCQRLYANAGLCMIRACISCIKRE